ncbi:MAG: 3-dehydroquinate synthase [Gemmatimonadetes bacterium]|nr:3-dehydroquinate synthase [Gemmatimonadota bacterium]
MVRVPLPQAAYDIVIGEGLLADLPALLQRYCRASRYAIISDSHVAPLYAPGIQAALEVLAPTTVATFPAGEWNKTRESWSALTDQLLAAGVGRDGAILALGGGVTGDLAGFVAATFLRGIPYVQIPTTLLAMIDSSVGGKTGVDTPAGKNLVGAFHQPRAVVADVGTLATLPKNQLAAGMAEALKHGAIADRGYFERLTALHDRILARDAGALTEVVRRSVEIKAEVVGEDEREQGRRAVLNFGHTVGHAVEAAAGFALLHGEAIALGMLVECEIGVRLAVTDAMAARALRAAVEHFQLPVELPDDLDHDRLLAAMRLDKKVRAGEIHFSLLSTLGRMARGSDAAWTVPAAEEVVRAALKASG